MTKAMAAIIRDMSEELNSLKARKEEIKKKALEHRDTFTDQEQADTRAAIKEINDKIKEKEERLAELRSEAEKNEKGVENMDNTLLHYSENMSRADLFETVEYRSAFFKKLQKTFHKPGGIPSGSIHPALFYLAVDYPYDIQVQQQGGIAEYSHIQLAVPIIAAVLPGDLEIFQYRLHIFFRQGHCSVYFKGKYLARLYLLPPPEGTFDKHSGQCKHTPAEISAQPDK